MQAHSLDLRQGVVRAYEQGRRTIAETAEQFGVSPGFVKKMLRQWRETADLAPLPHGGGKPGSLSARQRERLRRKARERDDISPSESQDYLRDGGRVEVHVSTICRALRRPDLPRKKSAWWPRSATTRSAAGTGGGCAA
jgi:transposase